ncbi:MAG: divalent-cation tolerance protein CutA [Candidatus Peribacteraceae bacterium]
MKKRATTITLLLSTFPTKRSAEKVARALLQKRLIACGVLVPKCSSLFMWEGKIKKTREVLLLCKTSVSTALQARQVIESIHPYDCPYVAEWNAEATTSYLEWMTQVQKQN